MTDANILSIAITLFAIAAGSIFNNIRISDWATAFNKRIDDVNKRIDDVRDFIKLKTAAWNVSAVLQDHEQRLRAITATTTKKFPAPFGNSFGATRPNPAASELN